jgi:hypothetical protein
VTVIAHVGGVPVEEHVFLLASAGGGLAVLTRLAWSGVRHRLGRRETIAVAPPPRRSRQ